MALMDVFLSHSSSDVKLAERLARDLQAHGLTVWLDSEKLKPGDDWQRGIADAIRSAEIAVLLIDRDSESDQSQQSTWQAVLEAVWQDPRKRLVPVLKRDARLPKFVRSASTTSEVLVLRLEKSQDLDGAIQEIVELSRGRPRWRGLAEDDRAAYRSFSVREPSPGSPVPADEEEDDERDEEDRRERLDYIERVLSMSRNGD